jgi:cobalt-zinc-cadmium efflux system protein
MREKKILWVIIFNLLIIILEILFGLVSNSFALITDALHNTGDVIAVVITYLALRLSVQQATFRKSFGFLRAEMMAGFVNTLFLFLTMFYMIYESIFRLITPEAVDPLYMIVVGTVATVANGLSAYILNTLGVSSCAHDHKEEGDRHHHHEDTNIRSAYLHMLADALISVGVVVAGIMIYLFNIYAIDALLTILFSVYILFHSYPLLKKSFSSLMDFNSSEIEENAIAEIVRSNTMIEGYSNLKIYQPSSKENFISFCLLFKDDTVSLKEVEKIAGEIKEKLRALGFTQSTIEIAGRKERSCINAI